jgi:hypothetical protein
MGFRVLPGAVTIETNQTVRFRGELRTLRGQVSRPQLIWEASGGSIDSSGAFSASIPGTYHVVARRVRVVARDIGRGRQQLLQPDTSVVVVVPRQPGLAAIRVTPRAPGLYVGETRTFTAVGRLGDGTRVPIGVNWRATGGTIDQGGMYQAGDTAGTYHVIAMDTRFTVADTVKVRISMPENPAPDPTPTDPAPEPTDSTPAPTLARIVLKPASVTLATRATHQFAAFGRGTDGDSVAVDVIFRATGGTITPTGLYTAGSTAGSYRVIASASELADTAMVTLATTSGGGTPEPEPAPTPVSGTGIPFGPSAVPNDAPASAPFTMSIQGVGPSSIVARLSAARAVKAKFMLNMTGGNHDKYMTAGVFDFAKWKAAMDAYNTAGIRKAVADAVADGTIVGNSVMDEPHVHGGGDGNTWGPAGTMTKEKVDQMCAYAKNIFPTLPVGVAQRHSAFEPTKSYRVCEFIISSFGFNPRFGSVTEFRDEGLAMARRDGHAIIFSFNILNGGTQDRDGTWDCTGTGGRGTHEPACRMTPAQVREAGLVLGPAGCALGMWRYDAAFMANPENLRAFKDVAARLATLPAKACRRQ